MTDANTTVPTPAADEGKDHPGFSKEEVDQFINMGKHVASKAVITAVIECVKDGPTLGKSKPESDRLVKKLTAKIPCNFITPFKCEYEETKIVLFVSLSIVPHDFRTTVDLPSLAYAQDLYGKYDALKRIAGAYWRQWVEENPVLFKRLCAYRDDVDFSMLTVDSANPTTMYFDPKCERRVGIIAYSHDPENNVLKYGSGQKRR
jgi:hypothetical protein